MVLPQKIFRLDSGQAQHPRNLKEGQILLAETLQSQRFQSAAGPITTSGKAPCDFIGDAKSDFHMV